MIPGIPCQNPAAGPQEVESCQPARQPATKAQPKPLQDLDAVPSSAPVAPPEQGALNSVFRQDQIDLLGERLTDVEVEELRLLEDNRDMPDYNAKVDQLIAAKMVAYGIATYEEIFPGGILFFSKKLWLVETDFRLICQRIVTGHVGNHCLWLW